MKTMEKEKLLTQEQICYINNLCKEFCDLKMGNYYKNANIGIDLVNKIKVEE